MDDRTRNEIAGWLERLAQQPEWNPEVWQRCHDLVAANGNNELLDYVYDDIIHYSGTFNSRNLLGFRLNPDENQLEQYQQEFRDIAAALRWGMSLSEARKKYDL